MLHNADSSHLKSCSCRPKTLSKVCCGDGWVGGGRKAFQSSAMVKSLDLGLEAWTKLNKNNIFSFKTALREGGEAKLAPTLP